MAISADTSQYTNVVVGMCGKEGCGEIRANFSQRSSKWYCKCDAEYVCFEVSTVYSPLIPYRLQAKHNSFQFLQDLLKLPASSVLKVIQKKFYLKSCVSSFFQGDQLVAYSLQRLQNGVRLIIPSWVLATGKNPSKERLSVATFPCHQGN